MHDVPLLVAVHGGRQSGKETIAEYLVSKWGYRIVRFAEPVDDMMRELLLLVGVPNDLIERCVEGDLMDCPVGLLGGRSTRFAMQSMGNEWRDLVTLGMTTVIQVRDLVAKGKPVVIENLRLPFAMEILEKDNARFWMVTNSRVDAITNAPPPNDVLRLEKGSSFNLTQPIARDMVAVLLRHCSVPEAMVVSCIDGELRDAPVAMLGGRTGRYILGTLLLDWKVMMDRGSDEAVSVLASHPAETVFPIDHFHSVILNESTSQHLHSFVDDALFADLSSVA